MIDNILSRDCPTCGKELKYGTKYSRYNADKVSTLCVKCACEVKPISHEAFEKILRESNKHFREGLFKIISEYKGQSVKLRVETKYGICNTHSNNLLKGFMPSITTAENKTEYFKKMLLEVNEDYMHGKFSIVGEYLGGSKILVQDKYSQHLISPHSLLRGKSLTIRSSTNKNLYTISKLNEIHNYKYTYPDIEYSKRVTNIKINCPLHGDFQQCLHDHYRGEGCNGCGRIASTEFIKKATTGWSVERWKSQAKKSKNFDSFKVYIIRCWNDDEEFYKIGRTFSTIKKRFPNNHTMPYNYEVIEIIVGTPIEIYSLEKTLKLKNKENKYIPLLNFHGKNECYEKYTK